MRRNRRGGDPRGSRGHPWERKHDAVSDTRCALLNRRRRHPAFVQLLGRYLNSQPEAARITRLRKRAESQDVARSSLTSVRAPARLTNEQNQEIADLYQAGWRPADIARAIGVTEWTVHHRLDRLGVQRRPISMTAAEIQEALRLNNNGVTITELTKQFNRSWKTIWKELRRAKNS